MIIYDFYGFFLMSRLMELNLKEILFQLKHANRLMVAIRHDSHVRTAVVWTFRGIHLVVVLFVL